MFLALTFYPFECTFAAAQQVKVTIPHLANQAQRHIHLPSENTPEETKYPASILRTNRSVDSVILDDATYLLTSPLRLDATSALVLGGVAAGIGGLMVADKDIRDVFQKNRSATKDDIADGLELAGSSYIFLAGHLGLMAGGFWFRENEAGDKLFRIASISLEAQMFSEATTGLVKVAAGRSRPNKERSSRSYRPFKNLSFDRSFPSGHAARAFTIAAVFADHYPQPIPFLAYSAASLIGLSRIYLDEHFSSDVFAGAALGFVIGKALSWHHQNSQEPWLVLPMLPEGRKGVGLTVRYAF